MMNEQLRYGLIALGALAASWLWAGPATAGIISTTGQIDVLPTPPASVVMGHLQSNANIFAFTEQTDLKLSSAVAVDIASPGTYNSTASLTPGSISAGTLVDSYFLHSDPVNNNSMYDASVTFSTPILGVIVLSASLTNSDKQLGAAGTTYPTGDTERGLELATNQDYVTLSANRETLTVHFYTHDNVDEVRIVTAGTVPEPSSIILAGSALALLAGARVCQVRRRSGK